MNYNFWCIAHHSNLHVNFLAERKSILASLGIGCDHFSRFNNAFYDMYLDNIHVHKYYYPDILLMKIETTIFWWQDATLSFLSLSLPLSRHLSSLYGICVVCLNIWSIQSNIEECGEAGFLGVVLSKRLHHWSSNCEVSFGKRESYAFKEE